MHFKKILPLVALVLFAAAWSCRKKEKPKPIEPVVFDKQAMLLNYADNVILPAYADFSAKLNGLAEAFGTFSASPSAGTLDEVKQHYFEACNAYQLISPFEFGPAENAVVRMNFNVFPVDTKKVNKNISSGSYDLATVSNLDAKGFPALDYLFYGEGAQVTAAYTSQPNRGVYSAAVITEMQNRISTVISGWDGYRNTFVNSLGTDVGSSIGFLVNNINFELDYLKNAKVGIPLGKKSLGQKLPEHCEAVYSGYSIPFALKTLEAIENLYRGRALAGTDGKGFDDYLVHLNSQHVNGTLASAIDQQFGVARARLEAIPSPLKEQVISNPELVDSAHTELLKLLVLLKTDMPSALGVVITYQDGDGD